MTTEQYNDLKMQEAENITRFQFELDENSARTSNVIVYTEKNVYKFNKSDLVKEFSSAGELCFETKKYIFDDLFGNGDTECTFNFRIDNEHVQMSYEEKKVNLIDTVLNEYSAKSYTTSKLKSVDFFYVLSVKSDGVDADINLFRIDKKMFDTSYEILNKNTGSIAEIGVNKSVNLNDFAQVGDVLKVDTIIENGIKRNVLDNVTFTISEETFENTGNFPNATKEIESNRFVEIVEKEER